MYYDVLVAGAPDAPKPRTVKEAFEVAYDYECYVSLMRGCREVTVRCPEGGGELRVALVHWYQGDDGGANWAEVRIQGDYFDQVRVCEEWLRSG